VDDLARAETLWGLVERRADATGDWLFGVDERGQRMTFGELRDAATRVAAALSERGIGEGSVVSWQLPSWLEAIIFTLALSRVGAVQNPLIPILRSREVGFICRQAEAGLLVVPGTWRGFDYTTMAKSIVAAEDRVQLLVADRTLPEADPAGLPAWVPGSDDPIRWYFYTSGTTADPKGAQHTDGTLIAGAMGFLTALHISAADRVSLVIPITHIGGIIHVIASLVTGCSMVLAETFEPEKTPVHLRKHGATVLPGSIPFVQAFFAFQDRHPELKPLFAAGRIMIHGGSPKPPHLHFEVKERLGTAGTISGYGMTECPMLAWGTPADDDEDIANTEGRPVPGVDVVIMKSENERAEPGEDGEVRVRGPQLMKGYVDRSLNTDAFDQFGYFRTGDIGKLGPRGHLTITGRLKDIIIRNMENISATELENLLYTHPKIADVAVIGIPNPKTGEHACAVVVPSDPADPPKLSELREYLLGAGLSDRKMPEQVEWVDELPRNPMEKVLKSELRRRFEPA
jgi:acyl-CoA synthetase (AMP-forming)/AMP-acid ligase II